MQFVNLSMHVAETFFFSRYIPNLSQDMYSFQQCSISDSTCTGFPLHTRELLTALGPSLANSIPVFPKFSITKVIGAINVLPTLD